MSRPPELSSDLWEKILYLALEGGPGGEPQLRLSEVCKDWYAMCSPETAMTTTCSLFSLWAAAKYASVRPVSSSASTSTPCPPETCCCCRFLPPLVYFARKGLVTECAALLRHAVRMKAASAKSAESAYIYPSHACTVVMYTAALCAAIRNGHLEVFEMVHTFSVGGGHASVPLGTECILDAVKDGLDSTDEDVSTLAFIAAVRAIEDGSVPEARRLEMIGSAVVHACDHFSRVPHRLVRVLLSTAQKLGLLTTDFLKDFVDMRCVDMARVVLDHVCEGFGDDGAFAAPVSDPPTDAGPTEDDGDHDIEIDMLALWSDHVVDVCRDDMGGQFPDPDVMMGHPIVKHVITRGARKVMDLGRDLRYSPYIVALYGGSELDLATLVRYLTTTPHISAEVSELLRRSLPTAYAVLYFAAGRHDNPLHKTIITTALQLAFDHLGSKHNVHSCLSNLDASSSSSSGEEQCVVGYHAANLLAVMMNSRPIEDQNIDILWDVACAAVRTKEPSVVDALIRFCMTSPVVDLAEVIGVALGHEINNRCPLPDARESDSVCARLITCLKMTHGSNCPAVQPTVREAVICHVKRGEIDSFLYVASNACTLGCGHVGQLFRVAVTRGCCTDAGADAVIALFRRTYTDTLATLGTVPCTFMNIILLLDLIAAAPWHTRSSRAAVKIVRFIRDLKNDSAAGIGGGMTPYNRQTIRLVERTTFEHVASSAECFEVMEAALWELCVQPTTSMLRNAMLRDDVRLVSSLLCAGRQSLSHEEVVTVYDEGIRVGCAAACRCIMCHMM